MTKEQMIKALEESKTLRSEAWDFSKNAMTCDLGCCYDSFNSIEECEECLNNLVGDDLDSVEVVSND